MTATAKLEPSVRRQAGRLIEQFMPVADVTERHETLIHAPADVVFEVAQTIDAQSIPLIRFIFWLRSKILGGAQPQRQLFEKGLVTETKRLGWAELALRPGRELVMGCATQPWMADVVFKPVAPDQFRDFAEPDRVKIVWTLEAEPLGERLTRFRHETRALATDAEAQRKFRRYWRVFGIGIVVIRWLLLPAIRREAERRATLP